MEAEVTTPANAARTAILTVDDDPGVSRAVARDLRRRYGEQHRIVRAESGDAALEALREMRLRGDEVAVIVADYRMPGMNGIEFLERAMDLYPAARRVLLTAYADTGAAIDAINVVDLDHYLLKPWDPPEEKLYPVLDELLSKWQEEERRPVHVTKLVGHRWSARSSEVREFLARNQVAYRWYESEAPDGQRLLAAAQADGLRLPVVITPDGEALVEPTDAELATRVGLVTTPSQDFYDLIVIGGGPAGLGAAVYGASEGLRTVLVERTATGGQAGQSSRIENYLGFPDGVSGAQLTERARRQATRFGAELLTTRDVVGLDVNGSARAVRFADGGTIGAHTVILATGVSYRQLDAPGLEEMTGRGVYYGSALTEAAACTGQDVYIVGGANSAGQAAVYLARQAKSVTILCRGAALERSMSYYLIQQIREIGNISVRTCTEVIRAEGRDHLESLTLRDTSTGAAETVSAGWLFLFIGAAPLTDWLDGVVDRDERGFVIAGPDLSIDGDRPRGWELDRAPYHLETSVPGVFVAGDARAESAKRVASAVGEGAMAVMLVHRYLEKL
jgi:thioredoxin reductase (NADPH)